MKKFTKKAIALTLSLAMALSMTACGSATADSAAASASDTTAGETSEATAAASTTSIQIAVPNDTTNEARALLLLQDLGYITLKDGAGITATKADVVDNPLNIDFVEVEAAQIPNVRQDVDYAIINSNYAIEAGIDPMTEALKMEGSSSAYSNILACKEGNEDTDKIKALKAALESQKVADYITETYGGAVVSTVDNPGDGFDSTVDYDALAGTTISCAASPTPHAEILNIAKEILAEKDITLDIIEYTDYVVPNTVVDDGQVDANYFQHQPYLDDFNTENGTHIVSVAAIHVEPMGLYGGKQTTLDALNQ
jgi:D-methionine transport system substrate-binding protein